MIQANELRVNNWVNLDDGTGISADYRQIKGITETSVTCLVKGCKRATLLITNKLIYPIPITEEILLKCGFKRHPDTPWLLSNGMMTLNTGNHNTWQYAQSVLKEIKYLHTLQNVFYALHQREMEVNI